MNLDNPDDRIVAAGEYVLGTLDAEARAEVQARLATDAALQAQVYQWQDRLLPLSAGVQAVEPDATLWPSIARHLPRDEIELSGTAQPLASPGLHPPAANDHLWRSVRRWRLAAGLSMVASVLLAVLLVFRQAAPEPARYLTLLQAPGTERTGWIVEATAGDRIRLVALGPPEQVPPGKSLQFWTKPEGAAGPTSLGLVRPGTSVEVAAERSPAIGAQQLLELTLEPEAGSPTGKPTGPILYVGRSVRL